MRGQSIRRAAMIGSALCTLALALGGCGAFDGPQGAGDIAGRQSPGSIPANITSATLIDIAERTRSAGDIGSAISFYRRALALEPNNMKTLIGLGDTLNMAGAPNEAADVFRQALATAPKDPGALRGLGSTLIALNDPAAAAELFKTAIAGAPDARSYDGLGIAEDLLGDYKAATDAYEKALALAPHDLTIQNNLGLSQALSEDYVSAVETLHKVASDAAAGPRHRLNLALVLGLAGRIEEAAQVARIDLDERAVRSNVAYYMHLRALPASLRAQAILTPGTRLSAQAKAPAATCDRPSCTKPVIMRPQTGAEGASASPNVPTGNPARHASKPQSIDPERMHALPVAPVQSQALAPPQHDDPAVSPGLVKADRDHVAWAPGAARFIYASMTTAAPFAYTDPALQPTNLKSEVQPSAELKLRTDVSGRWIQLGALRDAAGAEKTWQEIAGHNEALLKEVGHAIRRVDLGAERGVYFRLRAGPFNTIAEARALCATLKEHNVACFVVAI